MGEKTETVSKSYLSLYFCIEGRQEVKNYVCERYGGDKVAEIISFATFRPREAVRDIVRVLGLPYSLGDKVARLIDPKNDLEFSLRGEELGNLYKSDDYVRKLIDMALMLEGMPRHTSVHAAGIVISEVPLNELVPLQKGENTVITQYTMNYLESLGLLKMDFLGLRNLTIIRDAVNEIRKTEPSFDINNVPYDDGGVFKMLADGETAGVFQFESAGITRCLTEVAPCRLEDLIVTISLYRPGPMKSIPVYIENKKNPEKVRYIHKELESILGDTYGVIVYQEQVMEICRRLAGYSYGHADIVRRAMAKKKQDIMMSEREKFIDGAEKNGVPHTAAEKIFNEMSGFASYAFNRSHAASYACIAYQTAYLKYHYRGIYMAALLSSVMTSGAKLSEYIADCRSNGLEVLAPDINISQKGFTYADGKIYFGLLAVKNISSLLVDKAVRERANGRFTSLDDFCTRIPGREINKKAIENLIKAGAFDNLGMNRRQMLENYESIIDSSSAGSRDFIEGQMSFFGEDSGFSAPQVPEYDFRKILALENEATGIYLSGNPLDGYAFFRRLLKSPDIGGISRAENVTDNMKVRLVCIVRSVKQHTTKNGGKMCFLTVTDGTGEIDAIIFPDVYARTAEIIGEENIIFLNGRISVRDESVSVICEKILPEEKFGNISENMFLCIKCASSVRLGRIAEICGKFRGNTEVCFWFTDLKKTVRPKNRLSLSLTEESFRLLAEAFKPENIGLIEKKE